MSKASDRVIAGFMRLTESEQKEIITEITNYMRESFVRKQSLRENFEKQAGIVLGPTNPGGCPCCGR
ncbi:conserved hypothetical protein [Candidatus Brocadia pituitae]|nr:conserved hypothetical protein [Candidatus Brocadia pituitae]